MANELARLEKLDNGNLAIYLTDEGRTTADERISEGMQSDDAILGELLEYDLCNGWELLYADELGALSNAPVLSDDCDVNDQGRPDVADGHWWYFNWYQVRSVLDDLLEHGVAIFTKGE